MNRLNEAMLATMDIYVVRSLYKDATDFANSRSQQELADMYGGYMREHAEVDKERARFRAAWASYFESERGRNADGSGSAKRCKRMSAGAGGAGGDAPVDTAAKFCYEWD